MDNQTPIKTRKHPPFNVIYFFLCDSCRGRIIDKSNESKPIGLGEITPILCKECHPFFLNALDYLGGIDMRAKTPDKQNVIDLEFYRDRIIANIIKRMGHKESAIVYLKSKYNQYFDDVPFIDEREFSAPNKPSIFPEISEQFSLLINSAPAASGTPYPRAKTLPSLKDRDWRPHLRPYGFTWDDLKKRRK